LLKQAQYQEIGDPAHAATLEELPISQALFAAAALLPQSMQGAEFFSQPTEKIAKAILKRWLDARNWNEVPYLGRCGYLAEGVDFDICRQCFLDTLKKCPANEWLEITSFGLYLEDECFNEIADALFMDFGLDEAFWHLYKFDLLLLVALGILDGAWHEQNFVGFRINALGAYLLGFAASYIPPKEENQGGSLVVQPDYSIVLTGKRKGDRNFLERFLNPASKDDSVRVYKLDFAGVARALDAGLSVQTIKKYLAENATKELPGNVATQLDDWEELGQKVKIRTQQVTVLECDDPFLLQEIKHLKPVQNHLLPTPENCLFADAGALSVIKKAVEKQRRFCVKEVS
jgi:hypothetical protein